MARAGKKIASVVGAGILFAAITTAGCLIERFDKDAFIEESVVSEEDVFYAEDTGARDDGLININTADAETLEKLNGIGEALANRIIEWRETHGGFGVIEEIMNVAGISENKFEDIKEYICVE